MVTKNSALKAIKEAYPKFSETYILSFLNQKRYDSLWIQNVWEDDDMVNEFEEWEERKNGRGSI